MTTTDRERACFEAGIKFGSLYHQFAGTPVSPRSAGALESAIESAIENQPHCEDVSVTIHAERLEPDLVQGYTELTGRYMTATLTVRYQDTTVTARMELEDEYPFMRITAIDP